MSINTPLRKGVLPSKYSRYLGLRRGIVFLAPLKASPFLTDDSEKLGDGYFSRTFACASKNQRHEDIKSLSNPLKAKVLFSSNNIRHKIYVFFSINIF
jgi:hypothetical protein